MNTLSEQLPTAAARIAFLLNLPGVGVAKYWRLREHFLSPDEILDAPRHILQTALGDEALNLIVAARASTQAHDLVSRIIHQNDWLSMHGIHMIDEFHALFPPVLCHIKRGPPLLYTWGDPSVLTLPQIAIVGSRNPTSSGRSHARGFAKELATNGFVITSGLALGVDVEAHLGAMEAGGKTIAVMGTGIDKVYPARHQKIAEDIVAQG